MTNYDSFLKTALAKYKNAEFTRNEITDVLKVFTNLTPNLEAAEFADGSKKAVCQLQGTIPIVYKGTTYNTPITVWILDTYPFQAPVVYVTPTPSMYIRRGDNVDLTGKVHTQYLKKWRHPNSDLLVLIRDMAKVFGENPPLSSVKPSYAKGSYAEFVAHVKLENYRNAQFTKQEAINVVSVYEHLRPALEDCSFQDGTRKPLLHLKGTIPVIYKGKVFNIPVCIYLMENHPYEIPCVYVQPTENMRIHVNKHVDESGRVFMPYLSEWKYPNSDLLSLIQNLSVIFGIIPPVFSTSRSTGNNTNTVLPGPLNVTPTQRRTYASSTSQSTMDSSVSNIAAGTVLSQTGHQSPNRSRDSGRREGVTDDVSGRQVTVATAPQDSGQVPGRRNTGGQMDENSLASTEDFEIHCDPCHADHNFVEAEGYCKTCKEYYCKACLRYHGRIASTKNHAVLLKDNMPKP